MTLSEFPITQQQAHIRKLYLDVCARDGAKPYLLVFDEPKKKLKKDENNSPYALTDKKTIHIPAEALSGAISNCDMEWEAILAHEHQHIKRHGWKGAAQWVVAFCVWGGTVAGLTALMIAGLEAHAATTSEMAAMEPLAQMTTLALKKYGVEALFGGIAAAACSLTAIPNVVFRNLVSKFCENDADYHGTKMTGHRGMEKFLGHNATALHYRKPIAFITGHHPHPHRRAARLKRQGDRMGLPPLAA
ncbi:MAG: hypothetical protein AB7G06_05480 [Bdellovibrionales bacterium]